jgi:hypothetical protein
MFDSLSSSLYGASGSATSAILASNMVSTKTKAYIEDLASGRTRTVTAAGAITLDAKDNAGIYANSKIVSSSVSSSDGGASLLQGVVNTLLDADYSSSEGARSIQFGEKVRLAKNYIVADYTTSQGAASQTVATGEIVELADDYGVADFTTASGKRLLAAGDNVQVADDYDALLGEPGSVYQYLGSRGRVVLGVQDYTDTSKWKRITGEAGSTYRYIGSAALGSANLDAQDYADTTTWTKVAGKAGSVYEYMGADLPIGTTIDLSSQDYGDLGFWKPVLGTNLVPQGNNISSTDAMALGGLVVRNDVRSDVAASIKNATVTGGSVTLTALEDAVLRATAGSTSKAVGGSAWGSGSQLAVNGTIATNLVLSQSNASIVDSTVTSTGSGAIVVDAQNTSQIDAKTLSATSSAGKAVGVVLAFNTIGWESQNLLFNTIDALIGTSIGTADPAEVKAYILNSTVHAGGNLKIEALSDAQLNAEVDNQAVSTASGIARASGMSASAVLASNRVNATAQAYIDDTAGAAGVVTAGGVITITAEDTAGVSSQSHLLTSSLSFG